MRLGFVLFRPLHLVPLSSFPLTHTHTHSFFFSFFFSCLLPFMSGHLTPFFCAHVGPAFSIYVHSYMKPSCRMRKHALFPPSPCSLSSFYLLDDSHLPHWRSDGTPGAPLPSGPTALGHSETVPNLRAPGGGRRGAAWHHNSFRTAFD